MKYSIVYTSRTGNTLKLAETIKENLNPEDCLYYGPLADEALDADLIYVGFWTDKGRADDTTLEFLKKIRNKKLFIFGTCGFGKEQSYFDKVIATTCKSIDDSNEVVGTFICQGKMPQAVRDKYVEMKKRAFHMPNIDQLIENFDSALSHPDYIDLAKLITEVENSNN